MAFLCSGFAQAAALAALLVSAAFAQATACTGGAVQTREEGARRAEIIIEATVTHVRVVGEPNFPPGVVLEAPSAVFERASRGRLHDTITMIFDPCLGQSRQVLLGKGAAAPDGTRMRFYGSYQNDFSKARQFHYVEPADLPVVKLAAAAPVKKYYDSIHRKGAENPLGGGWHRANSTEGGFAVDMPGPFSDATMVAASDEAMFVVRSLDSNGAVFMASYQPALWNSLLAQMFERNAGTPGAKLSTFRGLPALHARARALTSEQGKVTNTFMIRSPHGTYLLEITSSAEREGAALKNSERFYHSIAFE